MPEQIQTKLIEEQMKEAYVDYAMSVIVSRALPDVRDGLKPVHRRILYAMYRAGLLHNRPYRKSAFVVGRTLASYHPHGDVAVYDSLVRMAQDFSLRYPLVDGQGNFGCFTKDTKVALTDGRNLSFKDLIKEYKQGKKNYTYTINSEEMIGVAEVKNPRLTKKREKIIKIILDNDKEIKCTLDHRFMLRNGTYKEAQKLRIGDSLMPLNIRLSTLEDNAKPALVGYKMVHQPKTDDWIPIHVLADSYNIKQEIYEKSAGRIRHHVDFNRLNNNPDNIRRINWKDHWKFHKEHASELHKDDSYRKKIAEGRRKYWADPKNRQVNSERLSERNSKNWRNPIYRKKMIKMLRDATKNYIENHPKKREELSKRLKELWKDKDYQNMMSALKSKEMKERWKRKDSTLRKFTSQESKEIWSMPGHREHISHLSKEKWKDKEYRKRMSEQAKALWEDEEYRAKYPKDHFKKMAKKLWENPKVHEFHREKALRQWNNKEFRERISKSVSIRNKKRLKENPNYMKRLAKKAKVSLMKKWRDPSYKEKVMKSKILNYVNSLIQKHSEMNMIIYEKERYNNGIPRIEIALNYFDDFSDMVKQAKIYNHKVKAVIFLNEREDVYDLTIDETHNFALAAGIFVHNSLDGDPPAAQRYTETKLKKIAEEMLQDIDNNTVKFVPNFDNSTKEPSVLPGKLPNLLINGSSGIAVGMATNIPPHNLREICDAAISLIDNRDIATEELMMIVRGPDFPTGGVISGINEVRRAYETGMGKIVVTARAKFEEGKKGRIAITEIPYMVNKSLLIEEIARLVRDKVVEGVSDVRDESDRKGLRIVIELNGSSDNEVVLNQLLKYSQLRTTFGVIMLALVDGEPRVLNLKEMIEYFILHRKDVVTKRLEFELEKSRQRAHILLGILVALNDINNVVRVIKSSKDVEVARAALIREFKLSELQANAILEMRLQRLTSLESGKVKEEHDSLVKRIKELREILSSEARIFGIIKQELAEIKKEYGDDRRTEIKTEEYRGFEEEELIKEENVVVTITHKGYIKRLPLDTYKEQRRGGKGIIGTDTKEEDFVEQLFVTSTHDYILFFSDKGKVYWLKAFNIPVASRYSMGKAVVNLLKLENNERVTANIPVKDFSNGYLVMATKNGLIKRIAVSNFSKPRQGGIIALELKERDELVNVVYTNGENVLFLASAKGMAVRFKEKDLRAMGRNAGGIKGINLRAGDKVASLVAVNDESILTVTEKGYGKRTNVEDYRLIRRGGVGVINIRVNEKIGNVVGAIAVKKEDEAIFISEKGIVMRTDINGISEIGRNTMGVRVMKLKEGDKLVSLSKVVGNGE